MGRRRNRRQNQPATTTAPQKTAAQKKKPMSNTVKVALITATLGMIGVILAALISTMGNVWIANRTAVMADNIGQGFQISENDMDWESGHPFGFHARLDNITDMDSALKWLDNRMFLFSNHEDQQSDVTLLCIKFLDDASAYAAGKAVPERDIVIGENEVSEIMHYAIHGSRRTRQGKEEALGEGGPPSLTLISRMDGEISLTLSVDVLNTEVGRIEVRKSYLTETLDISDAQFQEDLSTAGELRFTYDTSIVNEKPVVALGVPYVLEQNDSNYVSLRLPKISEGPDSEVMLLNQEPVESSYNAETREIETTVRSSGLYSIKESFADISYLPRETQVAIRELAANGIIAGYSDSLYHPNNTISRAQFISMLLRSIKARTVNYSVKSSFIDVRPGTYYYHYVTAAERYGLVSGYSDRTFRPNKLADRLFVYTTIGKVLQRFARAQNPSNPSEILAEAFPKDTELSSLNSGDRMSLALCVMFGILTPSDDGLFISSMDVTRAEIAVALNRMLRYL